MTGKLHTVDPDQEMLRPTITLAQARGGEWVTPPVSYVDPTRRFCLMTGRPIARRYWRVVAGDVELAFAGPAESLLYATYPKSHASR